MSVLEFVLQLPRLAWSFPIFVYQVILSPLIGNQCRFKPTCSRYTLLAILRHGIVKGTILGVWRIARCNPYNPGGDDPVPNNRKKA